MENIRKSAIRGSQRLADSLNVLNKLVTDSHEISMRQSLNPMPVEQLMFKCFSDGQSLSREYLQTLIKIIEKEILIIGLILPTETLAKCYKILTGYQTDFANADLNCIFLHRHALAETNTMLLLLSEDYLPKQIKLRQKLLLNLSLVLITTEQYAKKRFQPQMKKSDFLQKKGQGDKKYQRERERQLLIKNASLMIIKEEDKQIGDDFMKQLQNIFWNVETINKGQLEHKLKKIPAKDHTRAYRQGYHGLSQDSEDVYELIIKLNQMGQIALKRNWKVSKGLLCYPFLYYLTSWIKDSCKDTRVLLDDAVTCYCKILEEKFIKIIDNINTPTDELKLRNTLSNQKRSLILSARKHFTMLQHLFPELDVANHCVDNLNKFYGDKERNIYESNNIEAMKANDSLLRRIYSEIIETHFEKEDPPQRTVREYQADFQQMMDVYGNEGLRVSSQLKSFNLIFAEKKLDYTDNLSRELRTNKKKYTNEKEELKDRLQIQAGVLETLQGEIKDLLDKRMILEQDNTRLKKIAEDTRNKRAGLPSSNSSSGRKKQSQGNTERKSPRKEAKTTAKSNKPQNKKAGKCCCQVM